MTIDLKLFFMVNVSFNLLTSLKGVNEPMIIRNKYYTVRRLLIWYIIQMRTHDVVRSSLLQCMFYTVSQKRHGFGLL